MAANFVCNIPHALAPIRTISTSTVPGSSLSARPKGVFRLVSAFGAYAIAVAAAIGLALPELAAQLRPYIGHFVVLMLTVSLLRVDLGSFVARLNRPLSSCAAAVWISVAVPLLVLSGASLLLAAAGTSLFGAPPGAMVALAVLFLFTAPPPIVSAPAFAMLMGLDGALVLAVMLVATLAMPLTAPWIAALFVAEMLPVTALDLALRLGAIIAAAFALSFVARAVLGAGRIAAGKSLFDTLSVLIAMLFAIGAMDGVATAFADAPGFTTLAALSVFGFMLLQVALTYALFRPFVGVDAVAIAYAAGNRNAGLIVAAVGVSQVDDTLWLFFALSQLPVFLFPVLLKSLGQRLSRQPSAEGVPP